MSYPLNVERPEVGSFETRGAVEHGKLGVNMEMGERVAQHQPPNVSVEPNLFGLQISAMWFRNSSSGLEVSSWESGVVGTVS